MWLLTVATFFSGSPPNKSPQLAQVKGKMQDVAAERRERRKPKKESIVVASKMEELRPRFLSTNATCLVAFAFVNQSLPFFFLFRVWYFLFFLLVGCSCAVAVAFF